MDQNKKSTSSEEKLPKQLASALPYVTEGWIPIDLNALARLSDSIGEKKSSERQSFLKELREEPSLFLLCLRELQAKVKRDDGIFDPIQALYQVEREELQAILELPKDKVSQHSLKHGRKEQYQALQSALISGTVAESISPHMGINPELGYSCAILRQLGVTLVAWNYPNIYKRALANAGSGESLDSAIQSFLGFSPSMLAIAVTQEWGLPAVMRSSIGDRGFADDLEGSEAREIAVTARTIKQICKVGEALARASHPEYYTESEQDWQLAKEAITNAIGPNGIELVVSKVSESCEKYMAEIPELKAMSNNIESALQSLLAPITSANEGTLANPYKDKLHKSIKRHFDNFYQEFSINHDVERGLDTLMNKILPACGFRSGCIFLLEPERLRLAPRLAVGKVKLAEYPKIKVGKHTETHPLSKAFRSGAPILEYHSEIFGQTASFIVGSLGESQKMGVLFIEVDDKKVSKECVNPMLNYKAIRHAMNDLFSAY